MMADFTISRRLNQILQQVLPTFLEYVSILKIGSKGWQPISEPFNNSIFVYTALI